MIRILKYLPIVFCFLLSSEALAFSYQQPVQIRYPVSTLDPLEPAKLLQQKMSKIQAFMQSRKTRDPATVLRFLQDEVSQYFDLDKMAQWIGGNVYTQMSIQERASFQNLLKEKMFAAISRQLGIFSLQSVRLSFLPPRRIGPTDVAVVVRVLSPQQPPIRMIFKFHHIATEGWRVFDVAINGISALAYYRRYYRQGYAQYGPQIFLR